MSAQCDNVQHHAGGSEFHCKKCAHKYCVLCSERVHRGFSCDDAKIQHKKLAQEKLSAAEDAEYDMIDKCDAPIEDAGVDWDRIELSFESDDEGA